MIGPLSFDGKGVNGPDEHRSRLATFVDDEIAQQYGPLFAAAPELLEALQAIDARINGEWGNPALVKCGPLLTNGWDDVGHFCRAIIAKAT